MKKTTPTSKPAIWRLFSSLRLTVLLLILLAGISVFGTFIPPEEFDIYHSLGFRFLIGCLALNLIICSVEQFPATWKRFSVKPGPDRDKPFENLPAEQSFYLTDNMEEAGDKIRHLVKGRYVKIYEKTGPDKRSFYAEKGRLSLFGVYMIHGSVLVILMGALVGSFFGFEGFVNIVQGEQVDTVSLPKQRSRLKLGFDVRCDKFTRTFYKDGTIKEYRSDLTFLIDEKEIEKKSLIVNHPLRFRGISFYQSTFGAVLGSKLRLSISRNGDKQKAHILELEAGTTVDLPDKDGKLAVLDAKTDFMGIGPAVLIAIIPKSGDKQQFWVFHDYKKARNLLPGPMLLSPKFDASAFKPYTFSLDWLETLPYTGLQVTRDPGIPMVWTGFSMMVAGFLATFFMSHKRMWVRVEKEKNGVKVRVAGSCNKNPMDLQREIEKLLTHLKTLSDNGR